MASVGSNYKELLGVKSHEMAVALTWWDLVERATKAKFRSNIAVPTFALTQTEIAKFVDEIEVSVECSDPEPKEVSRVLVDINVKEYCNCGEKENDKTVVKIEKPASHERRYNFSSSTGINWGSDGTKKIIELGLGGETSHGVFGYNQEEKVVIPPGKKALVKVITSSVKYQQGYTLKFSISSDRTIPVRYKKLSCCGLRAVLFGPSLCRVSTRELFRSLPGFKEEGGKVSFTQAGLLEWVGEGCSVKKTEEIAL